MDIDIEVKRIYEEAKAKSDLMQRRREKTTEHRKNRIEKIAADACKALSKVGVLLTVENECGIGLTLRDKPFVTLDCTAERADDDSCWVHDKVRFFHPDRRFDEPLGTYLDHERAVIALARMAIAKALE